MNKTIIIAEAGVNHNGDIKLAKSLVVSTVIAGAVVIKNINESWVYVGSPAKK